MPTEVQYAFTAVMYQGLGEVREINIKLVKGLGHGVVKTSSAVKPMYFGKVLKSRLSLLERAF